MNLSPIRVHVLSSSVEFITVKLPFLDVPVQMNHELFRKRINSGYFYIIDDFDQPSKIAS